MPLIQVKLIEGVFSNAQKQEMIRKLTDAMVSIEGETMRSNLGGHRRGPERELGHRWEGPDHGRDQGHGGQWMTGAVPDWVAHGPFAPEA